MKYSKDDTIPTVTINGRQIVLRNDIPSFNLTFNSFIAPKKLTNDYQNETQDHAFFVAPETLFDQVATESQQVTQPAQSNTPSDMMTQNQSVTDLTPKTILDIHALSTDFSEEGSPSADDLSRLGTEHTSYEDMLSILENNRIAKDSYFTETVPAYAALQRDDGQRVLDTLEKTNMFPEIGPPGTIS